MRRRIRSRASEHRVFPCVITSYEVVMNDRRHLQTFMWRYLVIDEGHRIKNLNCRLIRELKQLESVNRLLLTGTPLQNNLSELWSLLNFLLPEIFDDLNIFESWFDFSSLSGSGANEKIIAQEREKNVLAKLHQILTPFLLRRLKQDVELCIPPKKELQVFAPLTATQQTFYAATLNHTITQMLDARNETQEPREEVELNEKGRPVRKSAKKVNYNLMLEGLERGGRADDEDESDAHLDDWVMRIAKCTESRYSSASCGAGKQRQAAATAEVNLTLRNAMMQLRKICNHPYLIEYPLDVATGQYRIDEDVVRSCGKMMLLDKMLPRLRAAGHKVLIFSQMTRMLDILQDYCYLRKLCFSRLDGSMAHQLRAEQIQQFQEDSAVSVFLLSTRAGGLGINLVAADTVIIYDSDWNPQSDLQAQDRCHRIGQTKPVVIFRFVTADTIDEKIVERAAAKRKLEKIIMHKGKFKGAGNKNFKDSMAELDPRDLLAILKSTDHTKSIKNDSLDISDNDLALLLDRSDLLMYQDARVQSLDAATSGDTVKADTKTSTLFKVIDEEEGQTELKMESSETC
ncbi:PREDICTED: lymphoid-specific helicase-like [Priapulus caudatus]|uniref:Lymphoid-specific helicase-like n=1 Tax=Priapulus caudatus TaxID=37621 RepID=A0ABM1EJG5_PRICU|nr:PREDICTED: lymphoid-specific helicase-like [Priapulus caudatus]XP_014672336.1 PREDICTED: lymphoid-specific helicase-like [Priapulus caudatus]